MKNETDGSRWQVALYFGTLTMALGLGRSDAFGLAQLPIQFYLKDRLHLEPEAVAKFALFANIPFYFNFLCGYLRDRWQPFGWGDRGYLLAAAPVAAGSYVWLARGEITYGRMLGAILVVAVAYQFLLASVQGMIATVGQRRMMTGRLGALWMFVQAAPTVVAGLGGGWLSAHIPMSSTFLLIALIVSLLFWIAFWRPAGLFAEEPIALETKEKGRSALLRLFRHRPYWFAAGILLCWNIVPGWFTPLFFHMTKTIGMQSEQFGTFNAIMSASNALAILVYVFLCRHLPLRPLLWVGTLFGFIPNILLALIRAPGQALVMAVFAGLLCGIANAGFMDLLLRCCPRKLEGTGTTLVFSINVVAVAVSDVFGAWLYERGGFALALSVSASFTASIFFFLPFLPKSLISHREGEAASVVA